MWAIRCAPLPDSDHPESQNVVDIKPSNMEDLTEVITAASPREPLPPEPPPLHYIFLDTLKYIIDFISSYWTFV